MHPHSRFWLFVLTIVIFLLLTTALCADGAGAAAMRADGAVAAEASAPAAAPEVRPSERPATILAVTLFLHVVATAFGLRAGMKIFYESAMFGGFCAILLIDALLVTAMHLAGPLYDGFTAMLGPQVVVTGLFMVVTLRHFGFSKDRFTVIPAVLAAKAFGFFAEVALRMLFRDVILRWAGSLGW